MTQTENIGLNLFDSDGDKLVTYATWREKIAGTGDDSNMKKIDEAIGALRESASDIGGKADKRDTVLETTLSMGRKAGTTVGQNSVAVGQTVEASGQAAHAEGSNTTASEAQAHAEGLNTTASGVASHAEGNNTVASGEGSHASGGGTVANASYMFAIGTMNKEAELYPEWVSGKSYTYNNKVIVNNNGYQCNVPNNDTVFTASKWKLLPSNNDVAFVIGNGSENNPRSNAVTIKWDGSVAEGSNTTISGINTHAEGYFTQAQGTWSHAEGYMGKAIGDASHVEGYHYGDTITYNNTTYPIGAKGAYSHAEGYNVSAIGQETHAEGSGSLAIGTASHVEGMYTRAIGPQSHAEGSGTEAIGEYAHAEGCYSKARGVYSHAEGGYAQANGDGSHAEGNATTASGYASHAEGDNTTASGDSSHAEGNAAQALGQCSHAEGRETIANHMSQHVFGDYNIADSSTATANNRGNYVEIVGNGSSNNRSNARTLDWSGNEWIAGSLKLGSSNMSQTVSGHGIAIGDGSTATHNNGALAVGGGTRATGSGAVATGGGSLASGNCSFAMGAGTTASGEDTHAEGNGTTASGQWAHAEGLRTEASGQGAHAEGNSTIANVSNMHASGSYNIAATEYDAWVSGTAYKTGNKVVQDGYGCVCLENNSDTTFDWRKWQRLPSTGDIAFVIGNGTGLNGNIRSNALTVDWEGNEELSGNLTVSGGSITVGSTTITEAQLQALLALLT